MRIEPNTADVYSASKTMGRPPKIISEKPRVATLWLDTAIGIKLAKVQTGELREPENHRMVKLKQLALERVRNGRLLCPEGEQQFEFWGKRMDNDISIEFTTLSRGIRMLPFQAIHDSQAFVAMAAYVHGDAEVRLPAAVYFPSDPVADLRRISQQKLFVSASGVPATLLQMNCDSTKESSLYLEKLRCENVATQRTYLEQFALERQGFARAIASVCHWLPKKVIGRKVDPLDLIAWPMYAEYFHQWHRLTGKSWDWEGLSAFLVSDYFCELPAVKIASQLYAMLVTDSRTIEPGDSMDVKHLSAAIPMGYFVVTDGKMAGRIAKLKIDDEWNCKVFSESTIDGLFAELEKI